MSQSDEKRNAISYKDAGVDIAAGNALVDAIKPLAAATKRIGAGADLGGFGGLFDLKACGYRDPLLVAANDGVGTKVKIAIETGHHDTIGIDLVAMSVNDLVVQGAEPLFFLDYFACSKLDNNVARDVIGGIADGCVDAGCALIGGETAEMPGMYAPGDYDLAGFCVGAVERDAVLPRGTAKAGDKIVGLAASGPHSNGYSLIRKLVEVSGLAWDAPAPFDTDQSLGAALLEPTRIYVKPVLEALKRFPAISALAHITGGGLTENLPRVAGEGLGFSIDLGSWTPPPVFGWLAKTGGVETAEMLRTFNCGIGMCLVVEADVAKAVCASFEDAKVIGEVADGAGVSYSGTLAL